MLVVATLRAGFKLRSTGGEGKEIREGKESRYGATWQKTSSFSLPGLSAYFAGAVTKQHSGMSSATPCWPQARAKPASKLTFTFSTPFSKLTFTGPCLEQRYQCRMTPLNPVGNFSLENP